MKRERKEQTEDARLPARAGEAPSQVESATRFVAVNELVSASFLYNQGMLDVLFLLLYRFREDQSVYSFTVGDLEENCTKQFSRKDILRSLRQTSNMQFRLTVESCSGVMLNLFTLVRYDRGVFSVMLTDEGRPFFRRTVENFTCMNLNNALMLNGKYSKRLYMIVSRYRNLGYAELPVDTLQHLMYSTTELAGKGREAGRNFMFVRDLERAVTDINRITELEVSMEKIRSSRTITAFRFSIRAKGVSDAVSTDSPEYSALLSYLVAYRISVGLIREAFDRGLRKPEAEEYVRQTVARFSSVVREGGTLDTAAYLAAILEDKGYIRSGGRQRRSRIRTVDDRRRYEEQRAGTVERIRDFLVQGNSLESARNVFDRLIREYGISESEFLAGLVRKETGGKQSRMAAVPSAPACPQ